MVREKPKEDKKGQRKSFCSKRVVKKKMIEEVLIEVELLTF